MNFLLTIRHAVTGLEQNFHDHQGLANFLHTVGDDLDNWIGHDAHGELPPPHEDVVAAVAVKAAEPIEPKGPVILGLMSTPDSEAPQAPEHQGAVFGGTANG